VTEKKKKDIDIDMIGWLMRASQSSRARRFFPLVRPFLSIQAIQHEGSSHLDRLYCLDSVGFVFVMYRCSIVVRLIRAVPSVELITACWGNYGSQEAWLDLHLR
jgi:hypothetical protein